MDTPNPYFNSDLGAPEGSFWLAGISEAWEPELLQVVDSRLQRFPGLDICRVPALRLHLKKRGTVGLMLPYAAYLW